MDKNIKNVYLGQANLVIPETFWSSLRTFMMVLNTQS